MQSPGRLSSRYTTAPCHESTIQLFSSAATLRCCAPDSTAQAPCDKQRWPTLWKHFRFGVTADVGNAGTDQPITVTGVCFADHADKWPIIAGQMGVVTESLLITRSGCKSRACTSVRGGSKYGYSHGCRRIANVVLTICGEDDEAVSEGRST